MANISAKKLIYKVVENLNKLTEQSKVKHYSFTNKTYHTGEFDFYKTGNVVNFVCGWGALINTPAGRYIELGTIPEEYRPNKSVYMVQGAGNPSITVFINSDGAVRLYNYGSTITSGINGYFQGTWIAGGVLKASIFNAFHLFKNRKVVA